MTVVVQSSYAERMDAARAGMVAGSDFDAVTGVVETVAGIGFGLAASHGSVSDQGVVIGGTSETFFGITIRDVTQDVANSDKYTRYGNAGLLRRGEIWVSPSHAVAPGDKVYFVPGTGVLTNQSSGNEVINGAEWRSTCEASGYARVFLSGFAISA